MMDLIRKIFSYLGLSIPPEGLSSDEAIRTIAQRMDQVAEEIEQERGPRPINGELAWKVAESDGGATLYARSLAAIEIDGGDEPISERLCMATGLSSGSTVADLVQWVKECEARIEHNEKVLDFAVARLTQEALEQDKILPHETDLLASMAREYGYTVAEKFVEMRPPQFRQLREHLAAMKSPTVEIDEEQAKINAQLGVSEETFRRYNPAGSGK